MSRYFNVRQEALLYESSDEDLQGSDVSDLVRATIEEHDNQMITYDEYGLVSQNKKTKDDTAQSDADNLTPIKRNKTKNKYKNPLTKQLEKPIKKITQSEYSEVKKQWDSSTESGRGVLINNLKLPKLRLRLKEPKRNIIQSDEHTYELEKFNKNAMIIFNHKHFLVERSRAGTDFDVAALERTFKLFQFQVTTHNDLKKEELFDELNKFKQPKAFKDYGCICVAILTHGEDHGYLKAYDTGYQERDVIACFDGLKNPALVGKPIILLIQACRGRTAAYVVPQGAFPVENVELDAQAREERHYRPTESDMIIFHSSFFGRASVRVPDKGSWFIQTFCEQMQDHGATEHLEKLFRRVRRVVAINKEFLGVKQMPVVTTTLLKKLYLRRGIAVAETDELGSSNEDNVRVVNKRSKLNLIRKLVYLPINLIKKLVLSITVLFNQLKNKRMIFIWLVINFFLFYLFKYCARYLIMFLIFLNDVIVSEWFPAIPTVIIFTLCLAILTYYRSTDFIQ